MTNQILRLADVQKLTGLSRSSIYQQMSDDMFPHSVKLGKRAVGWIESEIAEWISDRISATRKAA